jgi:hypothetical protein
VVFVYIHIIIHGLRDGDIHDFIRRNCVVVVVVVGRRNGEVVVVGKRNGEVVVVGRRNGEVVVVGGRNGEVDSIGVEG